MRRPVKQIAKAMLPAAARRWWADRRLTRLSRSEESQRSGHDFRRDLIAVAGLQPHHHLLEPGCGWGRNALPLVDFLKDGGSYDGFDILAGEIEWAQRHISVAHPQFRFQHAHVYNKYYNILDGCPSTDYRFPYAEASFDVVCLRSVFTHMLRADVEHYVQEIARVLKLGGRCYATYYLLRGDNRSDGATERFPHRDEGCFLRSREWPEWEVAYDEADLHRLYAQCGLPIERVMLAPDPQAPHAQDAVLALKE